MKDVEQKTLKAMAMTPDQVNVCVAKLHPTDIQELRRVADDLAQRAAWLSEYLDWYGALGTGNSGRSQKLAVHQADAKRKAVRKAIGYAYP